MNIILYNTLSRSKEIFSPIKKDTVTMYNCGPTVYDTPHIGNYRAFLMADLIRRVFEYNAYTVIQAMNITDVDDKTIRRSRAENVSLETVTRKYEALFLEGLKSMNVQVPHHLIRATEYIPAMIELIQTLIDKKVAYISDDAVYLRISDVKNYGELAKLDLSHASQERISNDEYDKESPRDFALWKFKTAEDGEAFWNASFGDGRPGWHIECSAMAMKALGPAIDIHTGGIDLIFPHHTNEIAQSESATGKRFVHYWMHGAFVNVNQEKMSKSKGSFIKLEDFAEESVSPLAYRYWLLTAHYRSPVNFTYEAVKSAQTALIRLMATVSNYPEGGTVIPAYREDFESFINDDIDTAQALALTWELIKDAAQSDADKRATILDFDHVFGLKLVSVPKMQEEKIPPEITVLAEAREDARKVKDWAKADALRAEIEARGFQVLDSEGGFTLKAL